MSKARKPSKPGNQVAVIMDTAGTDEEVREQYAEHMPDWNEQPERVKAEIVRLTGEYWSFPTAPGLSVTCDGPNIAIGVQGKCITLAALRQTETFASNSPDLCLARINDIVSYHKAGKDDVALEGALNAHVAFVRGGNPEDPVQSALLVQMAATHDAAMKALTRSGNAEYAHQAQLFGNLSAKLLNAYARQAETLAKLQRGGEQVVKHVHLNVDNRHGGQAIVTETFVKGGAGTESGSQPHATSAACAGPSMLGNGAGGTGADFTKTDLKFRAPRR